MAYDLLANINLQSTFLSVVKPRQYLQIIKVKLYAETHQMHTLNLISKTFVAVVHKYV